MQNGQGTYQPNGFIPAAKYHQLSQENHELKKENIFLKEELAQLKRMVYGAKSERFVPDKPEGQLSFDFDIEEKQAQNEETEQVTYTRNKPKKNKKKPVRVKLPPHLEREETIIEPETEIPEGAKKIGVEITEILELTPAKFYVKQYRRPKYALPEEQGIVIGELPTMPIPKGNAGPGLLAHLLISKFVDHLPFYRQVKMFKRQGVEISESTINGWFMSVCRLLSPLYACLRETVQESDYIMGDETPIPVQTTLKPGATHKGYHWVYLAPLEKVICFDYQKGRGRDGPKKFLEHFEGALQTDGYNAYDIFENKPKTTLLGCLAHARRKFEKALGHDKTRATYALSKIQDLYKTERKARENGLTPDERKQLRQEGSVPVLKEIEEWLKEQYANPNALPKSNIIKAINYTLNLWPRLTRYVENGQWEIDNNLVENSIRPVALGRKNYLFAGSHQAAEHAAMIYSFVETCRYNNIEPYQWLKETLIKIPGHPVNKLRKLLPGYNKP